MLKIKKTNDIIAQATVTKCLTRATPTAASFATRKRWCKHIPFYKFWTRKLKNQIYNCSCLQGVQRPRKRDFEKCMGRVRKTPLSRVSVKTSNNQIKVTTGITNMNNRLTWELRYNSSLFAYGQTGSGKSWSVFGYGINKGIFAQVSVENTWL